MMMITSWYNDDDYKNYDSNENHIDHNHTDYYYQRQLVVYNKTQHIFNHRLRMLMNHDSKLDHQQTNNSV